MAETKKGVDTMKELRDWLVTKCRLPGFGSDHRKSVSGADSESGEVKDRVVAQPFSTNFMTPRTIPQFVIPGSTDSSRHPSIGSNDEILSHSSGERSITSWSASTSPGISPRSSFSALAAPAYSNIRIRSAPVSPRRDSHGFLRDFGIRSMCQLAHVHGDQSPLANGHSSVPVWKFYSNGSSLSTLGHCTSEHTSPRKGSLTIPAKVARHRTRRMHRSFQDFYYHHDDRAASPNTLHVNHVSPEYRGIYTGMTDKNDYLPVKESFRRSQRYYRRRSSLVTSDVMRLLYHRQSLEYETCSNDSSKHLRHRRQLVPIDSYHDKRHSSPEVSVMESGRTDRFGKTKSSSLNRLSSHLIGEPPNMTKTETERGDLKFSFQYFPATRRLKVILIRAEGLRFPSKPDLILNPFFKVCLMPGKLQKQSTEPTRQNSAPVLNKEFFFTELNLDEMKNLRLRIMTFHKAHHLKLPEYLGEVNVPLANYDLLMENRMWNDLHFKPYKKDLGHLQIELLLDSRQSKLLVGVCRARGLPNQHLTGAPDSYVRVSVLQFEQVIGRYQTAVKKNNIAPVFNEMFESQINVRSKALSCTKIVFDIHDRDRLRGDPLLGQVIMGPGSTEDSVTEHWEEVMVGNGRKICRWHYVMEKGENHD